MKIFRWVVLGVVVALAGCTQEFRAPITSLFKSTAPQAQSHLMASSPEPALSQSSPITVPSRSSQQFQAKPKPTPATTLKTYHYRVKSGDTLSSIANRTGSTYLQVAALNNLAPPYQVYVGQVLKVPNRPLATASVRKPAPALPVKPQPVKIAKARVGDWVWPARGQIIHSFAPNAKTPNQGIDIAGKSGEPVRAAKAGLVVYSGNGVSGYGNLILIRHRDGYLSAYANNQQLLVQEGQKVQQNQKIATMGQGSNGLGELHFEIRYHGQPVNPTRFLSRGVL